MVRPLLGVVTAGVIGGQLAGAIWLAPRGDLAAVAVAAALAWLGLGRRPAAAWAAIGTLAFTLGVECMRPVMAPALPLDHVARRRHTARSTVEGRVVQPPDRQAGRTVVVVEARAILDGGEWQTARGRVRLAVRGRVPGLRFGDRLRFHARLRPPRGFANPGSFDLAGHLARRDVRVLAFVWDARDVIRLPARERAWRVGLERWRTRLGHAIARAVAQPARGVLQALVIGDERRVDPAVRAAFVRTGTVHVLSISGLHVGIVGVGSAVAARRLLALSETALLTLDVRAAAALLGLGPAMAYAALAGFGTPTLRSTLMLAASALLSALGRRVDVLRALALAALALALALPGAPCEVGFQLSFVSVLALVVGTRRCGARGDGGGWVRGVRMAAVGSTSAVLGTAPLLAFYFHEVSLIAPVANLLVIPLLGAVVVALGLAGAVVHGFWPGGGSLLFRAAAESMRPGLAVVRLLAAAPGAAVRVPALDVFEVGLLYTLMAGAVFLRRPGGRALVVAALAGLAADAGWWIHGRLHPGVARVTFLDVGQGDAAVAELPGGRVLVIDAGGTVGGDLDTGAAVVEPFLLARKILVADAAVITHAHPDHFGGVAHLVETARVREVWWNGLAGQGPSWHRLREAMSAAGLPARVVAAGEMPGLIAPDGGILHPPRGWQAPTVNDSSVALRLGTGAATVVLAGDVESRAEALLVGAGTSLRCAVLKVPHHGSATSSTAAFVAAAEPAVAIISVGAGNRYGLPVPAIEARYRERGACVLRTDRCGAITVALGDDRLVVRAARPECACPGRGRGVRRPG